MSGDCLGVFAKFWEPGTVKTRLAKSVGDDVAAAAHRLFVDATIARFSAIENVQRYVAYAPDSDQSQEAFGALSALGWQSGPQSAGDLGARMEHFFRTRFDQGHSAVVLLGSDSPNVPLERIHAAFSALKEREVVLGPTEDGGYYLVGMSADIPPIFAEVPWSTPAVWQTTIQRLESAQVSYAELQPWYDVDEMADLERLLHDIGAAEDPILAYLDRELRRILAA